MIEVKSINKFLGQKDILSGISLKIKNNERIGLIGKNGSGKSTLLKIIIGEIEPDEGKVVIDKNEKIGYLPQSFEDEMNKTVEHFLFEKQQRNTRLIWNLFKRFNLQKINLKTDISGLSGGELTKISLVKILIGNPTTLILDEPANNIDINGLMTLRDILLQFKGSILLVSHNRWLLDKIVNKIADLQPTQKGATVNIYIGNFSQYKKIRGQEIKQHKTLYQLQEKKIRRLKDAVRKEKELAQKMDRGMNRFLRKEGRMLDSRGTKLAKQAKAKETRLIKIIESDDKIKKPIKQKGLRFSFGSYLANGQRILKLEKLYFSFENHSNFLRNINLEVFGKDRIAIIGPSGSGKTTLLKILANETSSYSGEIKWHPKLKIGYLPQQVVFKDNEKEKKVLEWCACDSEVSYHEIRKILGKFLFSGSEQSKKLKSLSSGEKTKLFLAKIVLSGANFLLLDELTNYLDISSIEAVEIALNQFDGAFCIVSHDWYFIKNINIEKIYYLKNGHLEIIHSLENLYELK